MTDITTKSGFTVSLDDNAFDDMELFDAIVQLDSGNRAALPTIVDKLLGADKKRLYDHVRTESGRVPMTAVSTEVAEIITGASNAKK